MNRIWKILVSLGLARVTWHQEWHDLGEDANNKEVIVRIYGYRWGRKRTRKAKPRAVKPEPGLPFEVSK